MKVGSSASFYCVKCKTKRDSKISQIQNKGKVNMLISKCPKCQTKMCRFASK